MKALAPQMTEDQLLQAVRDLARLNGFATYHTHRSDRSEPGFPDLVLVRPPLILFRELKSERGRLTDPQREWLRQLRESGQDVGVWRPSDLRGGAVAAQLARVRRAT